MSILVWSPLGVEGWDWLWIILGLFLDVGHWAQIINNRKNVPAYTGP